ncbi:MAG: S8 family serine peptidase [Verrucomicrobia bacterium]|nr:S8 family serine peptidase [Verrucomicrobiota bacterium]
MRFSLRVFTRNVGVFLQAVFCALVVPCAVQAGFDFDQNGNVFGTGQAVISFKPGTTLITMKSILARYGADPSKIQFVDGRSALVRFDERKDVLSFCQQMAGTGWATASCPNYMHRFAGIPNDTHYSLQWGLKPGTSGATPTIGADFQGAWSYVNTTRGSGVKVGVLDSGIDLNAHPDLLALPNGPVVPSVGLFYRAMTIVPAVPGGPSTFVPYVFATNAPNDDVGHGTHVAGIIAAATSNGKGVAGGAPGSIIYPIKIGNRLGWPSQVIFDTDVSLGILFAATNGCRVINMSFGGTATGNVVTQAVLFAQTQTVDRTVVPNVTFKGVVCVAAMGNDGAQVVEYPAALPGVVAVGAHGPSGALAVFSTTGPWITLVAPGGDGGAGGGGNADNSGQIFSTYPTYNVSLGPPIIPKPTYTNYSYMSGTSMATPYVVAAAALLLQKKPYLSQAQVRAQLALFSTHTAPINAVTSATGVITTLPDTAFDSRFGYGYLNANSLVQGIQPTLGKTTGIPHAFPVSPRNEFTYPPGQTIPITYWFGPTGIEVVDVVRGNATNTFRVTVVDDRGERIPSAQVTARFTLLNGYGSPLGWPTTNVSDSVLLDNGTAAQDDLLNQDAVYGCKVFFPGSLSNCYYEVRYIVTASGMKANTNTVVNIIVQ